jgi:outer membrane receptor protein involved in Fe transport
MTKYFFTTTSVIFFLIFIEQVQAQDIEKITITSSRTNTNAQDLGSNVSWLDDETLRLIEHQHVNQAIVRVPGGWISRGNGQEHLTAIRSPVLTGAGGCGAFFIAQDGISLRAPGFCNANQLFDANTEQAQRIEVLRGPASTLYGSNAVHGVLNVLTPNPFDIEQANLSLSVGPHDYSRGMFSLGKAYDDNALLVYGNVTHDGGYKDESGFDQQKINVIHQYQSVKWHIKNVLAATNLNQETAGFIQGFEAFKDSALKKQNPNPEAFRNSQSVRGYSQVKYSPDKSTLFSITPYFRWTDMQFLQHFLPWQPLEDNKQRSLGFQSQFEKNYGEITLISGFDVDHSEGQLTETQFEDFSPNIPKGQHYDYGVTANVYSPFSQVLWAANDKLNLTAGLRYEHTRYDYDNKLSVGSACAVEVENCRFSRPSDQAVDFDEWSYQLSANYALSQDQSLYANYSKGYRAPQATELFRLQAGQTVADLDAEKINSVELGIRGEADNLFYDLTVFSMQKDNFIFQDTNRQNISNGETSHLGIELAVYYQWDNFYTSLNGTWAKHKYDTNLTLSRINIQGNEIDTAPEHMGSMQVGWRSDRQEFVELEWVHQGNYYLNPENTADYRGHNLVNLRAGMEIANQLSINARITNLTNKEYAERADFGFGKHRYFVGEPRAIYLSLNYSF